MRRRGRSSRTRYSRLLYQLGLIGWSEELFDGVGFGLFGAIEIVLAYALLRPLEWWRPVERWSERQAVRTDVVYTLVHRLGVVPAILFLLLTPIAAVIEGSLRFQGFIPPTLEQLIPPLLGWPFATFLLYVVVIDFGEYWRHRLQHRLPWWWALHSLHHDQRQMTLWADDRNHVLDDVLTSVWRGTIALLIGVAPAEFPLVMIAFRLVENLSHTNVQLRFGWLGTGLLVGPQYHRLHHGIEHARRAVRPHDGLQLRGDLPGLGHPVRHLAAGPRISAHRRGRRSPAPRSAAAICGISSKASAGSAPNWPGSSTAANPASPPPCRAIDATRFSRGSLPHPVPGPNLTLVKPQGCTWPHLSSLERTLRHGQTSDHRRVAEPGGRNSARRRCSTPEIRGW